MELRLLNVEAFVEVAFAAAQFLPNVPEGHKCRRMHGHSYTVKIGITGPHQITGMVMDFAELRALWTDNCGELDHSLLNEIDGLANPTSEVIAAWIFTRMETEIAARTSDTVRLVYIEVREGGSAGARVTLSRSTQ